MPEESARTRSIAPHRSRARRASAAALLAVLISNPFPAVAETERLDSDAPEAWAMFWFTSASIFSGLGTPREREPWSAEIGIELGNIPYLSTTERTVGFDGTKTENLNNSPIFARPVLTVGLPWRTSLSVAYVPPIRVWSVKPHLVALALERPIYEYGPWKIGARLHGQVGKTEGPFTCPGYVLDEEPGSPGNIYGCEEKSDDRAIQNYVGLETSGSWRLDSLGGLTPYLTLGANYLDTEFHTRALTYGFQDRTKQGADTWTFSLGTGVGYPLTEDAWVSIGLFYSPLWVVRPPRTGEEHEPLFNFRASLSYRLW
jgi:hypothetical protein